MLSRTEGLAAEPGRIDHALIEALVREDPLPSERRREIPEAFVAEGAIHEAQ